MRDRLKERSRTVAAAGVKALRDVGCTEVGFSIHCSGLQRLLMTVCANSSLCLISGDPRSHTLQPSLCRSRLRQDLALAPVSMLTLQLLG